MDSNNGFLGRIAKKLEDLSIKEGDLREQLEDIRRDRERYQAAWDIYQAEMGDEKLTVAAPGRISDAELVQMTIADAAEALIGEAGGVMRMADIVRRLKIAGKTKAKGTGAYSTVIKTLQRNPERFYKAETGKWGLVQARDKVPERQLL